jgi:hypothetical protein
VAVVHRAMAWAGLVITGVLAIFGVGRSGYEKTPAIYLAGLHIASIFLWSAR